MAGPTFATLRVAETIHVVEQALNQFGQAVRLGGISEVTVLDETSDVITVTNSVGVPTTGTASADVTGVASGTKTLLVTSSGLIGDGQQEVTVLNASRLIVKEDPLISVTVDDGDTRSIAVTAKPVDSRHVAGDTSEPAYACTDFLWTFAGSHYVRFSWPGHVEETTGAAQSVTVVIESANSGELAAGGTFRINVEAKNSAGATITGFIDIRLVQAASFAPMQIA